MCGYYAARAALRHLAVAPLCEDWSHDPGGVPIPHRPDGDVDEYAKRSKRMHELVQQHPGFISIENFETPDGEEVSLELFENDESVKAWRDEPGASRDAALGARAVLLLVLECR